MVRLATCLGENGKDILERLLKLRNQVFASEMLICVPSDLASNEYDLACCDADSIRIADRRLPAGWMKTLRLH